MSCTLTDYIRGFQKLNRRKFFSASVQAIFFAILDEFDLQGFPGEIELSTRELQLRSGLKSASTAHEAKNVLKNNRLIDFSTKKKRKTTVFTLRTDHLAEQSTEKQPEQKTEQFGLVCYTQKRGHAGASAHKVLNISKVLPKKRFEEEEEEEDAGVRACAGENCKAENRNFAENRVPCRHPDDLRTMNVCALWTYATGYRLSRFLETQLIALDLSHGRESFNLALTQAVSAKEDEERETGKKMFVKFNYFTTILRSLKKEGERNEKTPQATSPRTATSRTTSTAQTNRRASQSTRTVQQYQRGTPQKYEVPDYSNYPF